MKRTLTAFLLTLSLLCLSVVGQMQVGGGLKITTTPTAASFPVNGILDNFNRTNEGPPLSANWTDTVIVGNGGMATFNNTASGIGGGVNSAYWDVSTFGPNCEAFITLSTSDNGGVYLRLASPGTSGVDGYYGQYYYGGSQLFIKRIDNGAETILLTVNSFIPSSGDSIGLTAIGSTLELWYKVGAGAWTSKGTVADSTYSASGYLGISATTGDPSDDFGGGTL